jgi:hypothetical protein
MDGSINSNTLNYFNMIHTRAGSQFSGLTLIPLDSTYALKELFSVNSHPQKVILGAGVYRDNNSKPWVLNVVKKVSGINILTLVTF